MARAERTVVLVDGSRFSVYRRDDRVELIRTSREWLPDWAEAQAKAEMAIRQATGCKLRRNTFAGDPAMARARLNCSGRLPPVERIGPRRTHGQIDFCRLTARGHLRMLPACGACPYRFRDVLCQLLGIHGAVPIQIGPTSERPGKRPEAPVDVDPPLLVRISRDNEILLDGRSLDPRSLRANLSRTAAGTEPRLVIEAHLESSNRMLVRVMDAARLAGVDDIAIADGR